MAGIGFVVLTVAFLTIFLNVAYAQTTSEQVTLSGDLKDNPTAQEILKKIEKSKRWIENIQKRNTENLEKQKELEEKRAEVLKFLQDDLKKWEELWEYYTFDKMLERALENSPAKDTDSIYDHPLKFTSSKINAGREALQKVIENGGGPVEARDAFVEAAQISRTEMVYANILYNVLNNKAYYNQQILFNSDGQFDLEISGEELRKYYEDFRTNPEYLAANPLDKISWEDLGKNSPSTECRLGYVLVYRTHADDYVCTTQYTSEMWVRHNMGTIVGENFTATSVLDIEKLEQDRILKKVENLNFRIQTMKDHYEKKMIETTEEYESLFAKTNEKRIQEEKQLITKHGNTDSKRIILSQELTDMREKYSQLEENYIHDQSRILKIFQEQHVQDLDDFVKNYQYDSEINLVWNSDYPVFEINTNDLQIKE